MSATTVLAFNFVGNTIPPGCGVLAIVESSSEWYNFISDMVFSDENGAAINIQLATFDECACPEGYVASCGGNGGCVFEAWIGDGICDGPDLLCYDYDGGDCGVDTGCTNPSACNYNPEAVYDNGTCTFPDSFVTSCGTCTYDCDGRAWQTPMETAFATLASAPVVRMKQRATMTPQPPNRERAHILTSAAYVEVMAFLKAPVTAMAMFMMLVASVAATEALVQRHRAPKPPVTFLQIQ